MAQLENLKNAIRQVIKRNGNEEITGEILQQTLIAMVNIIGDGYVLKGFATPVTQPGTPDNNVFYFATQPGNYTAFGFEVVSGEIAVLLWNGVWQKQTLLNTGFSDQFVDFSTEQVIQALKTFAGGIKVPEFADIVDGDGNTLQAELNGRATTAAVQAISDLIPAQATAQNQLADKAFVNSSIATNTANFKGSFKVGGRELIDAITILEEGHSQYVRAVSGVVVISHIEWQYSVGDEISQIQITNQEGEILTFEGIDETIDLSFSDEPNIIFSANFDLDGLLIGGIRIIDTDWQPDLEVVGFIGNLGFSEERQDEFKVSNNDYIFIQTESYVERFKWRTDAKEFYSEYILNNSSFTAEQWETINSGLTSDDVTSIRAALTLIGNVIPGDASATNPLVSRKYVEDRHVILPLLTLEATQEQLALVYNGIMNAPTGSAFFISLPENRGIMPLATAKFATSVFAQYADGRYSHELKITLADGVYAFEKTDKTFATDTQIGDLAQLQTTEKSNIVGAINEIVQGGGSGDAKMELLLDYTFEEDAPSGVQKIDWDRPVKEVYIETNQSGAVSLVSSRLGVCSKNSAPSLYLTNVGTYTGYKYCSIFVRYITDNVIAYDFMYNSYQDSGYIRDRGGSILRVPSRVMFDRLLYLGQYKAGTNIKVYGR